MMVGRFTTYTCDKCKATFADYDEAEKCEAKHIVDETLNAFRQDIAAALSHLPHGDG